jgi:hypothetical protein
MNLTITHVGSALTLVVPPVLPPSDFTPVLGSIQDLGSATPEAVTPLHSSALVHADAPVCAFLGGSLQDLRDPHARSFE